MGVFGAYERERGRRKKEYSKHLFVHKGKVASCYFLGSCLATSLSTYMVCHGLSFLYAVWSVIIFIFFFLGREGGSSCLRCNAALLAVELAW